MLSLPYAFLHLKVFFFSPTHQYVLGVSLFNLFYSSMLGLDSFDSSAADFVHTGIAYIDQGTARLLEPITSSVVSKYLECSKDFNDSILTVLDSVPDPSHKGSGLETVLGYFLQRLASRPVSVLLESTKHKFRREPWPSLKFPSTIQWYRSERKGRTASDQDLADLRHIRKHCGLLLRPNISLGPDLLLFLDNDHGICANCKFVPTSSTETLCTENLSYVSAPSKTWFTQSAKPCRKPKLGSPIDESKLKAWEQKEQQRKKFRKELSDEFDHIDWLFINVSLGAREVQHFEFITSQNNKAVLNVTNNNWRQFFGLNVPPFLLNFIRFKLTKVGVSFILSSAQTLSSLLSEKACTSGHQSNV
jgi:hypothetical protein